MRSSKDKRKRGPFFLGRRWWDRIDAVRGYTRYLTGVSVSRQTVTDWINKEDFRFNPYVSWESTIEYMREYILAKELK